MHRKFSLSLLYVSLYVTAIVIVPFFLLVYYSFHVSPSNLFFIVVEKSLKQSLLQASLSTLISIPAGLLFGVLLIVYSGRWKNVIISVLLITYVMPGLIMGLGIISVFGYSARLWEIIYGNVIYNAPMIAVLAYSTGSSTNANEAYSAKILGASNLEIVKRFYFRNSLRGGLLGGILTFILSFEGFSLPLIIGGPAHSTIEVMIYEFKSVIPTASAFPFSSAAFLGLVQIIILMFPLYVYLSIRSVSRRGESTLPVPIGKFNSVSLLGLIAFIVFILLPLYGMFLKYPVWSINLLEISRKLQAPFFQLLANTLLFSFASTFIAFLVSIVVAVYGTSKGNQFLIFAPLIFSPVTLALSYFLVYGTYIPTSILIVLIFAAVIIPLNLRMIMQSIDTIPPAERSSSLTLGDSRISSFFRVQLPRIRWEISTILSLMFITVIGEFSSIVTVYTPSTETITIGIYRLLLLRDLKDTYNLTEIFLIVIFISSYIINRLGKSGSVGQA